MKVTQYQIKKYDKLAGLTFQNALRIHFDAILLYKKQSYSTAFALSILAMEELAKAHLIENIVWQGEIEGKPLKESWIFYKDLVLSHKKKQMVFANRLFEPIRIVDKNGKIKMPPLWRFAESGKLDRAKQNAFYVGIKEYKIKGKIVSTINNPLIIRKDVPKNFITIVNDYLMDLIVGVDRSYYHVDVESINQLLTKKLLKRLMISWVLKGRIGLRAIKRYTQ